MRLLCPLAKFIKKSAILSCRIELEYLYTLRPMSHNNLTDFFINLKKRGRKSAILSCRIELEYLYTLRPPSRHNQTEFITRLNRQDEKITILSYRRNIPENIFLIYTAKRCHS